MSQLQNSCKNKTGSSISVKFIAKVPSDREAARPPEFQLKQCFCISFAGLRWPQLFSVTSRSSLKDIKRQFAWSLHVQYLRASFLQGPVTPGAAAASTLRGPLRVCSNVATFYTVASLALYLMLATCQT